MIDILLISPEITKGMKSTGPKCLLPLRKNLTVIEYQISQLQKIKPSKITINIGFEYEKILDALYRYKTIDYLINSRYDITNQASNLISYIKKHKPSQLLVYSSGLLIKNNIILKNQLCHTDSCKLFILNKNKHNFDIGCSNMPNPDYLFYDMPESWAEIFYLNKQAIETLADCPESIFEQMYLFEVINVLLQKNILFDKIYINKSNIMKIQTMKDLPTARLFI
jgi:hypothetical protein